MGYREKYNLSNPLSEQHLNCLIVWTLVKEKGRIVGAACSLNWKLLGTKHSSLKGTIVEKGATFSHRLSHQE